MGVLVSFDQINDGFLDPDTQKHPYFPMIIKKNALFLKNFYEKVWRFKNNAYLCNPNQQKRWW